MTRSRKPLTDEQKASRAAYNREWRARNPEKIKEHSKRSREKNKDKIRARQRQWVEDNRDYVREKGKRRYQDNKDRQADQMMQRRVNMTLQQYDEMLASQGGGCAICGTTESRKGTKVIRFSVDHDRSCCPDDISCGKCVRGLLCGHCNVGIGHLRDSVDLLTSAVAYLTHHREIANQRGIEESRPLSATGTEPLMVARPRGLDHRHTA